MYKKITEIFKKVVMIMFLVLATTIGIFGLALAFFIGSYFWTLIALLYVFGCAHCFYIILEKVLNENQVGYLGHGSYRNKLASHLTEKVWNEMKLRSLFNEEEYSKEELYSDIKKDIEFLNTYGFRD